MDNKINDMNNFLLEKYFEIKYRTKNTLPPIIPKIEDLLLLTIRIGNNKNMSKEKIYFLIYFFQKRKETDIPIKLLN